MYDKLRGLPLDALKGFEAAARHLSFTTAAAELFLTQSAVSRQIQALERQLGAKLFRRAVRRLELTPEGELLRRAAADALDRLNEVCAAIGAAQRRARVTVSAAVGIASLWLVPRLAAFQQAEPDLDVLISADNRVADLEREDIDLALRYFSPATPPPDSTLLFGEVVFPVASPAVAATLPDGLSAANLARLTLLAFEDGNKSPWLAWEPWLQGLGLAGAKPQAVLRFTQYDQLIRAAEDGRGLALGRGPLVAQSLAAGRLQALPEERRAVAARAYFLVRKPQGLRPEAERFAAWLLAQAHQTEAEAG
jgi:LysR family glycine cleavage system transcriptional activator